MESRRGFAPVVRARGPPRGRRRSAPRSRHRPARFDVLALLPAAMLDGVLAPRLLHEDLAHRLRRRPEGVTLAVPSGVAIFHQTQIGLMDQRSRLERIARRNRRHRREPTVATPCRAARSARRRPAALRAVGSAVRLPVHLPASHQAVPTGSRSPPSGRADASSLFLDFAWQFPAAFLELMGDQRPRARNPRRVP